MWKLTQHSRWEQVRRIAMNQDDCENENWASSQYLHFRFLFRKHDFEKRTNTGRQFLILKERVSFWIEQKQNASVFELEILQRVGCWVKKFRLVKFGLKKNSDFLILI